MNDTVARATRRGRRPTAADERDITERIHAAEAEARAALAEVPEASALLGRAAPSRAFKTRVVDVDRLEAALRAAEGCAPEAGPVQRARAAWDQAQGLRWTLAVSAADVVPREAHRVAKASGMDVEDLANEGYIGLLRAATRFDPDRGVRFASYARWWARAQMTRAVDGGGRTVRLTGAAVEQLRNLRRARRDREQSGATYTVAELAADAGVTEARAADLLTRGPILSLDAPLDSEEPDGGRIGDGIPADTPDAEGAASSAELVERLRVALEALPDERSRYVVRRRFGLDDDEPSTLVEIGLELGLSRERVRQIEARAFRWLREEGGLGDTMLIETDEARDAA